MNENLTKYLDKKFQEASEERKEIKERLGGVEEKVESMEERLGGVEEKVESMEERLGNVELKVVNLEIDMKEVKANVKETKDIINKLFNRIDKFLAMLEKLDQEFTIMKKDIEKIKEVIKEKLGVDLF